jgi:succinyl-CoA synthetase beta subunit
MARLHEYQGKAILAANGFKIPRGCPARTAEEAVAAAAKLGDEVVIKIQAWTTGRAGIGGVAFAKKPDEVRSPATRMLAMKVGQFPVQAVLVEEKMDIVTAKDFLSAGKFTRCRRCDAAQALVSHLGNISMIKIERKVTTKLGWNP